MTNVVWTSADKPIVDLAQIKFEGVCFSKLFQRLVVRVERHQEMSINFFNVVLEFFFLYEKSRPEGRFTVAFDEAVHEDNLCLPDFSIDQSFIYRFGTIDLSDIVALFLSRQAEFSFKRKNRIIDIVLSYDRLELKTQQRLIKANPVFLKKDIKKRDLFIWLNSFELKAVFLLTKLMKKSNLKAPVN